MSVCIFLKVKILTMYRVSQKEVPHFKRSLPEVGVAERVGVEVPC